MSTPDFCALLARHRTNTSARGVLYQGTRVDPNIRYASCIQRASRESVASWAVAAAHRGRTSWPLPNIWKPSTTTV